MFKKIMLLIACIYSGCVMSMSPPYSPLVWDVVPTTTPEIYHILTTDLKTSQDCIESTRKAFLQTVWDCRKDKILKDIGHYLHLKDDKADPFESPQNYCLIVEYIQTGALDFFMFAPENSKCSSSWFFREMPYTDPTIPVHIPMISHVANSYISCVYRQLQGFMETLNILQDKIKVSDISRKIRILPLLKTLIPRIAPNITPTVEDALLADFELKRALRVMQTVGEDSVFRIPKKFRNHIIIGGTVFEIGIEDNSYIPNEQIMQEWIEWTLP